MKWVDEFRDPGRVQATADAIARETTRPWTIMEVCGGQTHTIARYALQDLLPEGIELVHGPGCPVCVTPAAIIEQARQAALQPDTVLATYGDMVRVPGLRGDLLSARAEGGDVRVVLSPLDAVDLARAEAAKGSPTRVVFFSVGFETTAPAAAMAIELADRLGLGNFSALAFHVRVPPAMAMILDSPGNRVQAFLAAGHVCTVSGVGEYPELAERFEVPIVVTGFEPLDLLQGVLLCVRQLERGEHRVEIQYGRAVRAEGNAPAAAAVERVFEVVDRPWRGLGEVAAGGLRIRPQWARFDAARQLTLDEPLEDPATDCRAAEVLQGRMRPPECPYFGEACTPDHPLGAPMVSSEGACAAYHRYRRLEAARHRLEVVGG